MRPYFLKLPSRVHFSQAVYSLCCVLAEHLLHGHPVGSGEPGERRPGRQWGAGPGSTRSCMRTSIWPCSSVSASPCSGPVSTLPATSPPPRLDLCCLLSLKGLLRLISCIRSQQSWVEGLLFREAWSPQQKQFSLPPLSHSNSHLPQRQLHGTVMVFSYFTRVCRAQTVNIYRAQHL